MAKYRNPRIEAEMAEEVVIEQEAKILEEPAKTVDEEIWKTRYADSQRGVQKMRDEHRREVDELRAEINRLSTKIMKPPANEDEIDEWMAQYPETARIVEGLVQKRIEKATAGTSRELERIKAREEELELEAARAQLRKLHPDMDELFKDEAFRNFVYSDPYYKSVMTQSFDVKQANLIMTAFKAQIGEKTKVVKDAKDREDAAKVVRPSRAEKAFEEEAADYDFSESYIEKMSKQDKYWFEKNEQAIHQALLKGRVLMDLSGGAR